MSSSLLNSLAVGRRSGDDADVILNAYIATGASMEFTHSPAPAAPGLAKAPKGTGLGDQLEPR